MMFASLTKAAVLAGLLQTSLGYVVARQEDSGDEYELDFNTNSTLRLGAPGPGGSLDHLHWDDVAPLQPYTANGKSYGCKCYPGESCWPAQNKWNQLNNTVGGRLSVHIPPAAACHNTFEGPLGTVNTYDAAACAAVQANWANESWT